MIHALAALLLATGGALAGPVAQVAHGPLADRLPGVMDFEALPLLPEPGAALDGLISVPGLAIGERFAGQSVQGAPHDALSGAPSAPLALMAGAPRASLSTAYHPGFGSAALFPLGPAGFPDIAARGEGAVALLFPRDVAALALKIHAEYPDPLGTRPPPGRALIRFYARDGALLDTHEIALETGVLALGFRGAPFAGVTITNDDPGGLAIDDIRFPLDALTG